MEQAINEKISGLDLYREALEWYSLLQRDADSHDSIKPNVLVLSTANQQGHVTSRSITISTFDDGGFVFFTNGKSRKCKNLDNNPRASLCAYWHPVKQQVSIDGRVEQVDTDTADMYWKKRSRDSQLTSWASDQSSELTDRQSLLDRFERIKFEFRNKPVTRPPTWRGYRLVPDRIEFWRADWHRPGVRTCYEISKDRWQKHLLFP